MKPYALFGLCLVLLSLFLHASVQAQSDQPPDMPPSIPDPLAPPPMPENPTQADQGAYVYYQVCMVCHGNQGQGLTDEWRGVLDTEDQDCWQSGCHHNRTEPGGFVFPRYVPPVVGPALTARFTTALELHDFLVKKMPWQAPGSRSEEEYWQLTTHLLRINGLDPGLEPLNAQRAAEVFLMPAAQPAPQPPESDLWLWLAGGFGLLFVLTVPLTLLYLRRPDG